MKKITNKKSNELKLIYLSSFLMGLAEGMIAIFVPIYLYKIGYSVHAIIYFYILASFYFVIFSFWGAKLVSKIGIKYSILLSTIFLISYYLLLNYIDKVNILFFILPLLMSFKMMCYNYGYHLNFVLNSDKNRRGRELSFIGIINTIVASLGPFIAGVIIVTLGFEFLFGLGVVILIIGALFLLISKWDYMPQKIELNNLFKYFKSKQNWRNFISFSGYAVESSINRQIWPIYLIILLASSDKLGLVISLSMLISIIVFYISGSLTDRYNKNKILLFLTGLHFLAWPLRLAVNSATTVVAVDSYKNIMEKFLRIPWQAVSYSIGEKQKIYLFIVSRELMFNLARVIVMPLLVLVFYIDFYPFIISFIIAAGFSLLFPALSKCEK